MNIDSLNLENRKLKCLDCGIDFSFSVGEQRFYISKGLSPPKRCPQCRTRRKDKLVKSPGGEE